MSNPPNNVPCESDAIEVVRVALAEDVRSIARFPTGLCHYVYDIQTTSNRRVVARLAREENKSDLAAGIEWSTRLRPLGVPLPELLHHDISAPHPYMLLDRLPGTDLWHIYPTLSRDQKKRLAQSMADIQKKVSNLPVGHGFGYARDYGSPTLVKTWKQVVQGSLNTARRWMRLAGAVDPSIVDEVEARLPHFDSYFQSIHSTPFLDDITTKNVIVDDGRLSGIVDVDDIAFGDPLYTLALTRMSLLNLKCQTDYVDYWLEAMEAGAEERRTLHYYTAVFASVFLGEQGQSFNRAPAPIDDAKVQQLKDILKSELAQAI